MALAEAGNHALFIRWDHNGRKVSLAQLEPGDTIGVGKTVLKLQLTR